MPGSCPPTALFHSPRTSPAFGAAGRLCRWPGVTAGQGPPSSAPTLSPTLPRGPLRSATGWTRRLWPRASWAASWPVWLPRRFESLPRVGRCEVWCCSLPEGRGLRRVAPFLPVASGVSFVRRVPSQIICAHVPQCRCVSLKMRAQC